MGNARPVVGLDVQGTRLVAAQLDAASGAVRSSRVAGSLGEAAGFRAGLPRSKLLLRHGIRFDDGPAWTQRHRDWLAQVALEWPAAQATLLDCQGAIDALCHRRDALEREVIVLLPGCPWREQVGRLRCLRG